MRLKPLVSAALLAMAAAASQAENITATVPLIPAVAIPGSFSAAFGVTHTSAGVFTDTFTITGATFGAVSASLVTIGFLPRDNLNFTAATLNGLVLSFTGSGLGLEVGTLPPTDMGGVLTLVVTGIAAPTVAAGTTIAASYGGTVNVSAPIPEPGSYALLLAGLGIVTLIGRRSIRS